MLVGLVVLVCGVIFFAARRGENIIVIGNLSAADIAQIKRSVSGEMQRQIFPELSLESIMDLPGRVIDWRQTKLHSIEALSLTSRFSPKMVLVSIRKSNRTNANSFLLVPGTNGWTIYPETR